jgi:hypothetical protein
LTLYSILKLIVILSFFQMFGMSIWYFSAIPNFNYLVHLYVLSTYPVISICVHYGTLQKYFSHPNSVIYFFPNPCIKLNWDCNGWDQLIATHLDQSKYIANVQCLLQASATDRAQCYGNLFLQSQTSLFWLFFIEFPLVATDRALVEMLFVNLFEISVSCRGAFSFLKLFLK